MDIREMWAFDLWRCELRPPTTLRLFHGSCLLNEQHAADVTDARDVADRWQDAIQAYESLEASRRQSADA